MLCTGNGGIFYKGNGGIVFNRLYTISHACHCSVHAAAAEETVIVAKQFKIKVAVACAQSVVFILFCAGIQLADGNDALHALVAGQTCGEVFTFCVVQAEVVRAFFVAEDGKFREAHCSGVRGGKMCLSREGWLKRSCLSDEFLSMN